MLLLCDNCCVGVRQCQICKGLCCTFVNDVVNAVFECGELDGDAKVNNVDLLWCWYCVVVEY